MSFFFLGLLVLTVIGAVVGKFATKYLGLSRALGTVSLMLLIGFLK